MELTCTRGILWPESEFTVLDSASAPYAVKIRVYVITGVEVDVWAPGAVLEQKRDGRDLFVGTEIEVNR